MTRNQIDYAKLLESKRAAQAQETLTRRRDEAAMRLGIDQLAETSRHNLAGERISKGTLDETSRSNMAKERETYRANVAKETETNRSNLARESETGRHNIATELTEAARVADQVAKTVESGRHNRVMELKDMRPTVITTVTQDTSSPSKEPPQIIDLEPVSQPGGDLKPTGRTGRTGGFGNNKFRTFLKPDILGPFHTKEE